MPIQKAKSYALRLLAIRPRSIKEIKDKLALKNFPLEDIDAVVNELSSKNYLNDLEFAQAFLRDRIANNPKGVALLKRELRRRGVEDEASDEALEAIKDTFDEKETARGLALLRKRALGKVCGATAKRRVCDYLMRRGFAAHTVYEVVKEVLDKDETIID